MEKIAPLNHVKEIKVKFLPLVNKNVGLSFISEQLNKIKSNAIDIEPWPGNNPKPQTHFVLAYGEDSLFLKYYVLENNIRAIYQEPNDPVHKDSCVEFFLAFEGEMNIIILNLIVWVHAW